MLGYQRVNVGLNFRHDELSTDLAAIFVVIQSVDFVDRTTMLDIYQEKYMGTLMEHQ